MDGYIYLNIDPLFFLFRLVILHVGLRLTPAQIVF